MRHRVSSTEEPTDQLKLACRILQVSTVPEGLRSNSVVFDETGANFVETEAYRKVRIRLLSDTRVALAIIGSGGSGKSTLLRQLELELDAVRRPAVLLSMQSIRDENDFLARLIDFASIKGLVDASSPVVQILARRDTHKQLLFDFLLDQLPGNTVLLLDDLQRHRAVARVIEPLVTRTTLSIVVTTRSSDIDGFRHFMSRFDTLYLSGFTQMESVEYLARLGLADADSVLPEALQAAKGNPLLLGLLAGGPETVWMLRPGGVIGETLQEVVQRSLELVLAKSSRPELVKGLMQLLAVRSPLTLQYAATLLDEPAIEIEAAALSIARRSALLTITTTGTIHELHIHEVVARAVAYRFGLLPVDVAELQFGGVAAEDDPLLAEAFQRPAVVDSILEGETTIVVAERGAGKTALFRHLSPQAPASPVVTIPAEDHHEFLQRRSEASGSIKTAEDFKGFWLLYTALMVSSELLDGQDVPNSLKRQAKRLLRAFNVRASLPQPSPLARYFGLISTRLTGPVKISIGPVKVEADVAAAKRTSRVDVLEYLSVVAHHLRARGSRLAILLDQLDEIHKHDRSLQEAAIQGLFLAERHLRYHVHPSVNLIVLIRSDLYRLYDIQEKNKLIGRAKDLDWEEGKLFEFLRRRTLRNSPLKKIDVLVRHGRDSSPILDEFALEVMFPSSIELRSSREWLSVYLSDGQGRITPRRIMLLLLFAKEEALRTRSLCESFPVFIEGELSAAMTRTSELSYEEVINDFRVAPNFVRNAREYGLGRFTLMEVRDLFGADDGPVSSQVEWLERLGFLQRFVEDGRDGVTWSFRIPELFTRHWGRHSGA